MANNHYLAPSYQQTPNYFAFSGTGPNQDGFGAIQPDAASFVNPLAQQAPVPAPAPAQASRNALPDSSASANGSTATSTDGNSSSSNSYFPVAMPTLPERKKGAVTDDLEPYKAEIVERLHKGETSRAIALDLASRGVNTTEAALVHRRLKWGIRMREILKSRGTPLGSRPAERSIWLPGGVQGEDYDRRALEAVQRLGVDPATADLTGTIELRRGNYRQKPPTGWLYPHNRGAGTVSNLDAFKDEIIERTRKGESLCEIADALMAKGVQTSDRAVGRRRLLWGFRQRKSKQNLKFPPIDQVGIKATLTRHGKDYYQMHPAKTQVLRRLEIARMTKEGLSAQEIADQLASRGVVWKRGPSSVARLQARWGLIAPEDNPRALASKRAQALKAFRSEQRAQFRQIAEELGVEDVDDWVELKMKEPGSVEARSKAAREKVGDLNLKRHPGFTLRGKPKRHKDYGAEPKPKRVRVRASRAKKQQKQQEYDDSDASSSESESESDSEESSSSESDGDSPQQLGADAAATAAEDGQDNSSDESDNQEEPVAMVEADAVEPHEEEQDPEDDPDSAENVAARIFARIGKSIPKATGPAPKPVKFYPAKAIPRPQLPAVAGTKRKPRGRPSAAASAPATKKPAPAPKRPKAPPPPPPPKPVPIPVDDDDGMAWDDGDFGAPPSRDSTPAAATPAATPAAPSTGPAQPPANQPANPWPSAPVLVVLPEEAEANKSTLDVVEQYTAAAQLVKDTVSARTENRALPGSLTGLPPSLKDVDTAKQRLKAAAHAMYTSL